MAFDFDAQDQAIVKQRELNRARCKQPLIGDFVRFSTGEVERFSEHWGESLQTSPSGSFYLSESGEAHFGGASHPATPLAQLEASATRLPGTFWIFHHNALGPGRAVYFKIPCRLYLTTATYTGHLGASWQCEELQAIRIKLNRQFGQALSSHRPSGGDAISWIQTGAHSKTSSVEQRAGTW